MTLDTGHLQIRPINHDMHDTFVLRAHAELPNNAFPIFEGRPDGLKAITQLCLGCPSLWNGEISIASDGNLTVDEDSGEIKMKRKQIRTKEELVKDLKSLSKLNNRYLNYTYVRGLKRHDLLFDAVKLFGGWRGAIKAAGFRPIQKSWTKKEILNDIRLIQKRFGKLPPYKELSKLGYYGLTRAAMRRFGSWNKAVVRAGFSPLKREWTKNAVINDLKEAAKMLNHTPSMRDLKRLNKQDLLSAMITHFGKYNIALKKANLPIVLEMNRWSKKKVVSELRKIKRKLGKKPSISEIRALGRYDLNMAAPTMFGSWNKAMIAAGFTPNTDAIYNKLGQKWEHIVLEIASQIYPNSAVHFGLPNRGLPDLYVLDEKLIVEAKINISENNVKSDTEKYLPYCKKLQIWYLYGIPPSTFSDKIELVGIDKIKPFLNAAPELEKEFKELIKEIGGKNVTPEMPKKVLVLGSGAKNARAI